MENTVKNFLIVTVPVATVARLHTRSKRNGREIEECQLKESSDFMQGTLAEAVVLMSFLEGRRR